MERKFNKNGLAHDLDHLDEMKDIIPFLPIEEQANYSDQICVQTCNNITLEQIDGDHDFEIFNTTSIGNLAYIALNSPNKDVREKAVEILGQYKEYAKSKNKAHTIMALIIIVSIVISFIYFVTQ